MSPHKLRKTRKQRGKRTVGWGQVGQHRKHGQKGGRKVGRHKHLWSYVLKHEPNYFGKRGFKTPQSIKTPPKTINIRQLDELTDKLTQQKPTTKKQAKPYIDLTALGYHKLLATGTITKPLTIKIDTYSENAAKKIQQAGGKIITQPKGEEPPAEEKTEQTKKTETKTEEPKT